ncbi:MAG: hypothetical protein WEC81_01165 [Patescibacteria group bacterium]
MKTLFGILLVGLLFISSLGYVAKRLENPEFLTDQTRKANLYGRVSGQLDTVLPNDFISGLPLDKKEVAEVIKDSITADEFYKFIGVYSKGYLDYWDGQSDDIKIDYSLTGVKDRANTSLNDKLTAKYDRLPICTVDQARGWDLTREFPNCRLSDGTVSDDSIKQQIGSLVTKTLSDLPDKITVDGADQKQQANRNLFSMVNTAIKVSWIATLVLILLMIIIFRRKAFFPLAISLLFVGLIQVGFSLVAWDWIAQNIGDALTGKNAGQLAPLGLDVAAAILEVLKTTLGNVTIITLGAGVTMLVLGIVGAVRGRKDISLLPGK